MSTGATTDSDNDGLPDGDDIDDDNDGVPDINECPGEKKSLKYEFYDIRPDDETVDNIPTSNPDFTGTASNFDVLDLATTLTGSSTNFSIRYTGYLYIDETDFYTFFISSDDGSKLFIDGAEVVNNDNGVQVENQEPGTVNLSAGFHDIEILYFQGPGVATLDVKYHAYDQPFKNIPFSVLYANDCYTVDTDGDGIPNRLDLDSDNDGCSDALEAGATSDSTDNFTFPTSGVGTNGLANSVESTVDTGELNYYSTYASYAVSSSIASCVDSDGDGVMDIVDIDDDNDGVPDTMEQTNICDFVGPIYDFESGNFGSDWTTSTNLEFQNSPAKDFYSVGNSGAAIDAVLNPTVLDGGERPEMFEFYWQETTNQTGWTGQFVNSFGEIELEVGGNNPEWEVSDGTGDETIYNGNGYNRWIHYKFTFDWENGQYTYYMEDTSTGHVETGTRNLKFSFDIEEFRINDTKWGSADYFWIDNIKIGTLKSCEDLDTDGDGIPDRLDLDSDGDGCSDALEAGATSDDTDDFTFPASGVGENGLADSLETSEDSGEINYNSTYIPYATYSNLAGCIDSDSDGVLDLVDIDDDNDGVPDAMEQSDICEFFGPEYDFETGALTSDWSKSINLEPQTSPAKGLYSLGKSGAAIDAVFSPSILDGGARPEMFEFYWQETTSQSGWTGQFVNSNDQIVLEVGGNNPEWEVSDGTGDKTIYNGNGYNRWIHYKFTFDWDNGQYTYYMEDTSTGDVETGTRDLKNSLDIEEFRINNSTWGSANYFWIDNIKIGTLKSCGDIDTDGDGTPDRLTEPQTAST
jgi:hypothetical protein